MTGPFRLAFAADPGTSDAFAFTCQRVGVPAVDRSALARHANGARRISEIAICAAEGSNLPGVLAQIAGGKPENGVLPLPNARLRTYAPGEFRAAFRLTRGLAEPPLAAIVFAGADIGLLRRRLAGTGVDHVDGGGRVIVLPAPGQGAIFAFEEAA